MPRPKTIRGKVCRCSVAISEELLSVVQAEATKQNLSASELMRQAIEQKFGEIPTVMTKKGRVTEQSTINRRILTDSFGHLKGKSFGKHIIHIGSDDIEFQGENTFSVGVDTPNFEEVVRKHITKLQEAVC